MTDKKIQFIQIAQVVFGFKSSLGNHSFILSFIHFSIFPGSQGSLAGVNNNKRAREKGKLN
jgi:hypothetical protein